MAEAEDVIADAARHATVYAQALWRRHRPAPPGPAPPGGAFEKMAPLPGGGGGFFALWGGGRFFFVSFFFCMALPRA